MMKNIYLFSVVHEYYYWNGA